MPLAHLQFQVHSIPAFRSRAVAVSKLCGSSSSGRGRGQMSLEERWQQLRQLLADAHERGDSDKVAEILSDITREFPDEPALEDPER